MAQWLMPNDFKPIAGHKFMFKIPAIPKFNFDGNVYCEVLEIKPCSQLVYSWKCGPEKGVINIDSIVTWTLSPIKTGTELVLEHTGFKGTEEESMIFLAMEKGWDENVQKVIKSLATK